LGIKALCWTKKYTSEIRPKNIYNKTNQYVSINYKTGEKLIVYGISWAIQETLGLSGVNPIKSYSLRSTAVSTLILNGMNIAHICKLLRHSNIRITQIYFQIKVHQLKKE